MIAKLLVLSSIEESEFKQKLGARIKALRREAGISQVELAYRSNMEKQNMYRLESGSENPTAFTLKAIAEALGISVAKLFDWHQ